MNQTKQAASAIYNMIGADERVAWMITPVRENCWRVQNRLSMRDEYKDRHHLHMINVVKYMNSCGMPTDTEETLYVDGITFSLVKYKDGVFSLFATKANVKTVGITKSGLIPRQEIGCGCRRRKTQADDMD